jgi:hypothetical protein
MAAHGTLLFDVISQADLAPAAQPASPAAAEWREALQQAVLHQCAPMFRERLRRSGRLDAVPGDVCDRLAELTRETVVKNFKGTLQLKRVIGVLDPAVSLLALKGASLAATCYDSVSLRPMHDLDLLARPADLGPVRAALARLGYRKDPRIDPTMCTHHDVPYLGDGLPVELHWSLLEADSPFEIDYDGLWTRAVPSSTVRGLYHLSVEDQLLHVCLHAGFHHELDIGLYAFIDVAMLARGCRVDWRVFMARAKAWRAERCVYLVLASARLLAAAPIPAVVLEELRPADFRDELLADAAIAIRYKRRDGYQPADFTAALLARLFVGGQWRRIPEKIERRLLRKPELRSPWPGPSPAVTWRAQLAPLWKGAWGFATSAEDRARLRARWNGARLQRWMR